MTDGTFDIKRAFGHDFSVNPTLISADIISGVYYSSVITLANSDPAFSEGTWGYKWHLLYACTESKESKKNYIIHEAEA